MSVTIRNIAEKEDLPSITKDADSSNKERKQI
jgi:hypothetical protein